MATGEEATQSVTATSVDLNAASGASATNVSLGEATSGRSRRLESDAQSNENTDLELQKLEEGKPGKFRFGFMETFSPVLCT
jgi:hypothetical protein